MRRDVAKSENIVLVARCLGRINWHVLMYCIIRCMHVTVPNWTDFAKVYGVLIMPASPISPSKNGQQRDGWNTVHNIGNPTHDFNWTC